VVRAHAFGRAQSALEQQSCRKPWLLAAVSQRIRSRFVCLRRQQNLAVFDQLFMQADTYPAERRLSQTASKNALFIMMYRDYPLLQLPYELLSLLLEIDEQLSLWRYRHIHMVGRTIGKRVGTGGSSGAGYLKAAADSHMIFKEIAELTSFLMPRHRLPVLPDAVLSAMGYHRHS
jgi:tryptophan 2,3-dioxygenase